jgi:hypothetical protein
MIEYPCLYSEQKFKKKKRYFDGVLKFFPERKICYLYSSSNTNDSLDSRILKKDELDKFVSLDLLELEFEKYIIQIEYSNTNPENYTSKPVTTSSLPKLGKFNIPKQKVVRCGENKIDNDSLNIVNPNENQISKKRSYHVDNLELDEIWGLDEANNKILNDNQNITTNYFTDENVINKISKEDNLLMDSKSINIWGDSDDD